MGAGKRTGALVAAPSGGQGDGGIDPTLAAALIRAIVEYPTFATACAACGVTDRMVRSLLERGVQPGAPVSLHRFAKAFARADADNARNHCELAAMLLRQGNTSGAKAILDMVAKRWKADDSPTVMTMLTSGKRSVELRARLASPPPLLEAMLLELLLSPNSTWSGLLERAGYTRALASPEAASEAPEPPGDGQGPEDDDSR